MAKPGPKPQADIDQSVISEAKDTLREAISREQKMRDLAQKDLEFLYHEDGQWDDNVKANRKGRPCMTFNRVEPAVNQVVNDFRQARPGIRVRAVDDENDPKRANIFEGLIRNIEAISDAETAYDTAAEFVTECGYGAWRLVTEFADDQSFDQDILIKTIRNPFSVYFDAGAMELTRKDAMRCVIVERMSWAKFRVKYPQAKQISFNESDRAWQNEWGGADFVRVAEYYRKVIKPRSLVLLKDGKTFFEDKISDLIKNKEVEVVKRRKVHTHVIEWFKITGAEVLDSRAGEKAFKYKWIPVVACYGKNRNILGEEVWKGMVRNAKDAQRDYNYHRSVMVEETALRPKNPYLVTAVMTAGHEKQWKTMHSVNRPYVTYNVDPQATASGGMPKREAPADVPAAAIGLAQLAADDIRATTEHHEPSLGAQGNEVSGIAINNRQREGDVGSFHYMDNMAKSIRHTGDILVDMIGKTYDTDRIVRILNIDGTDDFVPINRKTMGEDGQETLEHDLSTGKYDVSVDTGPSYTTKREQATDQLIQLATAGPIFMDMAADLIVKNLDMPGGDELTKRIRLAMIKQGKIQPDEEEQEELAQMDTGPTEAEQLSLAGLQAEIEKTQAQTEKLKSEAEENMADAVKKQLEAMLLNQELGFNTQTGQLFLINGQGGVQ